MKKLVLATSNMHKVIEIDAVLRGYGYSIKPAKLRIIEPDFDSLEEVAEAKARQAFEQLKKPVIAEDTGVYFSEYHSFPGQLAKRVYLGIGFRGLTTLIKIAKNKRGYFKTVISFTKDGKHFHTFSGILHGRFIDRVVKQQKNRLPYEKIFIPDGYNKALAEISVKEKNKKSHRAVAARKFGRWLKKVKY